MATAHHNRRLRPPRSRASSPRSPGPNTVQVPILSLKLAAHRLRTARASVMIAATVLHHQNADLDAEVGCVLQHQVAEQLSLNIDHLETLAAGPRKAA